VTWTQYFLHLLMQLKKIPATIQTAITHTNCLHCSCVFINLHLIFLQLNFNVIHLNFNLIVELKLLNWNSIKLNLNLFVSFVLFVCHVKISQMMTPPTMLLYPWKALDEQGGGNWKLIFLWKLGCVLNIVGKL
jgi:hypothetical protein